MAIAIVSYEAKDWSLENETKFAIKNIPIFPSIFWIWQY